MVRAVFATTPHGQGQDRHACLMFLVGKFSCVVCVSVGGGAGKSLLRTANNL